MDLTKIFPEGKGSAVAPEGERIGEDDICFHVTSLSRNIIEVAILITLFVMDSRGNKLVHNGENGCHRFNSPS
jgi:hypothetical protein